MKTQQSQYVKGKWSENWNLSLDSEQTLVLSFFDRELPQLQEILQDLKKQFPRSIHVGCSSSGNIFKGEVNDQTISTQVIQFEKTQIHLAKTSILGDSHLTGKSLASELNTDDLKSIFILSDGLNVNGTALIDGINDLIGEKVIVSGGLAGDGARFGQTDLWVDGEFSSKVVLGVGFYGEDILVRCASRGGWDSFGVKRKITKSKQNILYELDHKPALTLYKDYLGDKAAGLPGTALLFPIELTLENGKKVVRTVLSVNEDDQSMTFAGDIPEGVTGQLMQANFDRLVEGAEQASEDLNASELSGELVCISVSCVGRRLVLGERIEDETEGVLDFLPKGAEQVGFYSYGELSPQGVGRCDLHNQTMTLTLISEK